jgi:hypothetical protein
MGMHMSDKDSSIIPRPPPEGGKVGIFGYLFAGFLGLVPIVMFFLASLGRNTESARKVECATNLKQISLAIQLYAESNKGQYPDSLATLFFAGGS